MLKPSIDTLLEQLPSKYSLVILRQNGPTNWKVVQYQLKNSNQLNQHYKRLKKSSLKRSCSPDPEAKREALRRRIEAERIRKEEEERKIKEQIAKEKKMVKNFKVRASQSYFLLFKGVP